MTTTIPEKKTAFKPTADWVLVRPDPAEEKSRGGVYIPDSGKVKPATGTVLDVGAASSQAQILIRVFLHT